jgi:hypothetical protein
VGGDGSFDELLTAEVEGIVIRREHGLVAALRDAAAAAPSPMLSAAVGLLLAARQARLARFERGLPDAAPVAVSGPRAGDSPWGVMVSDGTVGAALGLAFLREVRTRLVPASAALDAALSDEPTTPDPLWRAAIAADGTARVTQRVVDEMTQELMASPSVSAQLGREGTLAAFAALFEAVPS